MGKFVKSLSAKERSSQLKIDFIQLEKPLLIYFEKEGSYLSGRVTKLSDREAIIETSTHIEANPSFKASLRIPKHVGGTISCDVVGSLSPTGKLEYRYTISQISKVHHELLKTFLNNQHASNESHETQKIRQLISKKALHLNSITEFSKKFFREIQNQTLVVPETNQTKINDMMLVRLSIADPKLPVSTGSISFTLKGKVQRKAENSISVLALDPIDAGTLNRMKRIVSVIQQPSKESKDITYTKNANVDLAFKTALSFLSIIVLGYFAWNQYLKANSSNHLTSISNSNVNANYYFTPIKIPPSENQYFQLNVGDSVHEIDLYQVNFISRDFKK